MKIGNVVLQNSSTELAGTSWSKQHTFVRILPLEVASCISEAPFIVPSTEIPLSQDTTVASILPVQNLDQFSKDTKQTNFKPVQNFKFKLNKFSTLAVVELTRRNFNPQVALVPLWGVTELPKDAKFVGVLECEGYAVSAQDEKPARRTGSGFISPPATRR